MTNVTEFIMKWLTNSKNLSRHLKKEMASNTIQHVTVRSHLRLKFHFLSALVFIVCPQGLSQAIVFRLVSPMSDP